MDRCSPCPHRVYIWQGNRKTRQVQPNVMNVMAEISTRCYGGAQEGYLRWSVREIFSEEVSSKLTLKNK